MALGDLGDHGRFSDPSLLVMSSLADGPKHGYAMTKDIQRFAGDPGPGRCTAPWPGSSTRA